MVSDSVTPLGSSRPDPAAPFGSGVPRLPRTYVPRQALWRRLDDAAAAAMVTLVAPPGAGKTLGVAGWLRSSRPPTVSGDVMWLGARRDLDDAWLGPVLDSAAPRPDIPGASPRLVVLDDAHDLPASAVRLLDARLNDSPQSMRILLLSRWDLSFSRLAPQLLGHLTTLRGDVLRLTDEESALLIREHVGPTVPEVVSAITVRAQGWCAAVVLTSRLVAASPDPVAAVRRVSRGNSKVADQVASEVFAALSPRERHLLLCTASDGEVTADTAAHLTHDPGAGDVLAGLESTGLLVTRSELDTPGNGAPIGHEGSSPEARFRIHPLLVEVVRRRIMAGGVDVERARSTVLRAVRLDVGRGVSSKAFRRLVDLGHAEAAAEQLAAEGPLLLMDGKDKDVLAFAERWPDVVEAHPESWFVLALERWIQGDVPTALHWFDRLLDRPSSDVVVTDRLIAQRLCARLMRARAGFEPMAPVARDAQDFIDSPSFHSTPSELQPHVLAELGIVQAALGLLPQAERNVLRTIRLSEDLRMRAHAATALTHLALIYYMRGREQVAEKLAARSLETMPNHAHTGLRFAQHRAELVAHLATMSTLPPPSPLAEQEMAKVEPPVHPADMTMLFWHRIRDARVHLSRGSVIRAERSLQGLLDAPVLTGRLRATLLIERSFLAALSDDSRTLKHLTEELCENGWLGEALLMRGVAADLAGDLRRAVDHFAGAAEAVVLDQPPCQALALTCQAQILHALGDEQPALDALRTAVRVTEVRGNYVPFLGWTRHGTAVHTLLKLLKDSSSDRWLGELTELTEEGGDITGALAPWTATSRERSATTDPMISTPLSPRERDVLRELARGATYADIAVELFVSENTVKTHVSSLYSKLGATRRSDALSIARKLELL